MSRDKYTTYVYIVIRFIMYLVEFFESAKIAVYRNYYSFCMSYVLDYPAAPESSFNPPQDQIITQEAKKVRKLSNDNFPGQVPLPETINWEQLFGVYQAQDLTEADKSAMIHFMNGYEMKGGVIVISSDELTAFLHIAEVIGTPISNGESTRAFELQLGKITDRFPEQRILGVWSMAIAQITDLLAKQCAFS
jgi:hypothetical protein